MKKEAATEEVLLDGLERRVHAAVEKIRALKAENSRLAGRIEALEGELEAATEGGGAAAWKEEREQVRRRVEALTSTLEGLLAE